MNSATSTDLLARVTRRLFIALSLLFVIALIAVVFTPHTKYAVPLIVIATGIIGGFVGLQRRLKDFTEQDLTLIAQSWVYTCLSPLVGGVLSLLLYVLFLSGLLAGDLFPTFVSDVAPNATPDNTGFISIFDQHGKDYQQYAKLVFWCFVAGFSERFVTDVISRFEGAAVKAAGAS